jgi:quinol monooxygenase YgiN
MIFIVVKFPVRPEHADSWLDRVREFTESTRAEPGNLFFEWSRSVDDPNTFVLVEAFADGDAGGAHVQSEHFRTAVGWMGEYVTAKPDIVNVEIPDASGWSEMGEISPR